jgi:hypothetical protein
MAEKLKLSHVIEASAADSNDPVAPAAAQVKLVAIALRTVAAKLDADAGVTDTNYLAVIDALTL